MNGRLCIFGEVLFDHFPDGTRVLGGAPFNVAWHLQALGQSPYFISRVGADREGEEVRAAMSGWGMETAGLQTDSRHPTGRVTVRFVDGEPSYEIDEPCAYDAIEAIGTDAVDCALFYHGSLALRSPISSDTVQKLRSSASATVFIDVNLRRPWWKRETVLAMLQHAHWVKLNVDELGLLGSADGDVSHRAAAFLTGHSLDGLVLTEGSAGAVVFAAGDDPVAVRPDADIEVIDTVGAGDAFAAVMILGLMRGWQPGVSLPRAQAFASAVVGQRGATASDPAFYRPFIDDWKL